MIHSVASLNLFSALLLLNLLGGIAAVDMTIFRSPSSSPHKLKGSVPLDVDGYPIAPPELELQQVHIYARHGMCASPSRRARTTLVTFRYLNEISFFVGERAPVGIRMSAPPASLPEHWMFCHTARRFRDSITSGDTDIPGIMRNILNDGDEVPRTERVAERKDGSVVQGEW